MGTGTITLNTGQEMPVVGLGTSKSRGSTIRRAIKDALSVGYRHFDCGYVYGNEVDIGNALAGIKSIKREELFISSKLGCSFQHPDYVERAFEKSLENLQLDYLDLYCIHWPFSLQFKGFDSFFPSDSNGKLLFDETIDYIDTWRVLENLYRKGKTKAIGVCNFNRKQLERLVEKCSVVPAVNQIECHPYLKQDEMIKFCKSNGIVVIGYSPFCSPDRSNLPKDVNLFKEDILKKIADKYNKTVGQVVLRYQVQRDVAVIPRSTNYQRIAENMNIFDFSLTMDDVKLIRSLDKDFRVMYPDKFAKHKHFPF